MEVLQRQLEFFRTWWTRQGFLGKVFILGLVSLGITAATILSVISSTTDYVPLVMNQPLEDVSAITAKLKTENIEYKLENGGSSIRVPSDKYAAVKVILAGEGIPLRGGKGFEIFDETALGMTPFVQNVNYMRALQAELARSIMQLEPISFAKVMIARPDPSPFVRDQKPTTASVVLKLKPNMTLNRNTATGIIQLVSRSVEGLKPENVTVVDSAGRMLSDPRLGSENEEMSTVQMEYRRDLENHLAAKAEEMLARHLGPGKAMIRVTTEVNFQRTKERKETFSPEDRAVAAERVTSSKSTNAGTAKGVAGAVSNIQRTGGASSGSSGGGTTQEETVSTDYLVSKSVKESEDRSGSLQRMTIAAMIDLSTDPDAQNPKTMITLSDAQEIIKQAVGFRSGRDEIKVSDVKLSGFLELDKVDTKAEEFEQFQFYLSLSRYIALGVGILVSVILLFILLRGLIPKQAPIPEKPVSDTTAAQTTPAEGNPDLDLITEQAMSNPEELIKVLTVLLGNEINQPATTGGSKPVTPEVK
jgi:flagellar M-ring protein FliF